MYFENRVLDDLRQGIISEFKNKGSASTDALIELGGMEIKDLLIRYLNWLSRFGPTRPVDVVASKQLSEDERYPTYKTSIDSIAQNLRLGVPLTQYLSGRVQHRSYVADSKSDSSDKDRLLNYEGVMHLQLGSIGRNGHAYNSNGDRLFLTIFRNTAYILGIGDHTEFDSLRWARIIIEEWPEEGLLIEYSGAVGNEWTQSERSSLRLSGVNVTQQIDGKAYLAHSLGVSIGGHSMLNVSRAIQFQKELRNAILSISNQTTKITLENARMNKVAILSANVDLGHVSLVEQSSGHIFCEWQLR